MQGKTEMLKGTGDTILGKLKKRVGETGEVLDRGLAWMERQAAETANMDVPVLSKMADAVVSPALVGARAALANVTSGGGKHYQPEVRDERYFSKAALRELGETVKSMRGRTWGRADGIDNAAQFNLTQTIGGFSVKNGAVTDKFDINKHYHGVPDALTSVTRTVLGREEDPDAGKVKTRIPLTALGLQQAAKGGDAPGESKSSAVPKGHNPALDGYSGPRVVINPQVMKDDRDALCVAFNESFRIIQEINGFDPVAEPTEKQRAFFADTAYRDDERMLRRTILSRICTFDTSVTDPTDEQLQEAVEFLDTVLEIGAPQNNFEQRAVERIRTAISQALESGERVTASQAPAPEGSPEVAAGGAGSSAGGVPEDEEKDSGAEFRENARAQMDEAAKLAQEGPTAGEQKTQAMAEAAGKAAGDDPFGKSAEMNAAAQEAGIKADIAEAQKPESLMQKNGHYVDAQGRVISERAARALAEQNVRNAAVQDTNNQQQQAPGADMDAAQNSPRTDSGRIGVSSGIKGHGGRELTAGESAWMARRQASTAAWMQRTGRSGDGVADAIAQRDERANNLRQFDSGRRGALGRKLDDRGRVIA